MQCTHIPVLFATDEDGYGHDLASLQLASPSVTRNVIYAIAGSKDTTIQLQEACALSSLWSSVRLLRLWIEEPDGESDFSTVANSTQGLRLSPFKNLQSLSLYDELPTRLISSILAHTPLLRELEVVPFDDTALGGPSPAQPSPPSSQAYPEYQFYLRKLSYLGDDCAFFGHLFAQSRGTLSWLALMLHDEPSDDFFGCIEKGNRVQKLICLLTEDFRTFGDPATAYRLLAAFPRLRVLMMDHDQLAASPEMFTQCEASLHCLVIALDADSLATAEAGIALLISALRGHARSVRQLQKITLVHDSDYPHYAASQTFADLRALCAPRRIHVTKQTLGTILHAESFASMLSRLVA